MHPELWLLNKWWSEKLQVGEWEYHSCVVARGNQRAGYVSPPILRLAAANGWRYKISAALGFEISSIWPVSLRTNAHTPLWGYWYLLVESNSLPADKLAAITPQVPPFDGRGEYAHLDGDERRFLIETQVAAYARMFDTEVS